MKIFVSYASNDAEGEKYLEKFLTELATEMRVNYGSRADLFYRDIKDLKLGELWPDKLGEALCGCSVMLALCSPSYLNSEYCAREFAMVQERHAALKRADAAAGRQVQPIIPIHWVPPLNGGELPLAFADYHTNSMAFPPAYRKQGLRELYKFRRRDSQRVVTELARQLAALLDQPLPPAPRPARLGAGPVAWPVNGALLAAGAPPPPAKPAARHIEVRVAIAAGAREELEKVRDIVAEYGERSVDWCPFGRDTRRTVAMDAMAQALAFDMLPERCGVDDGLCQQLMQDGEAPDITLLIADPWTMRLPDHAQRLRNIDKVELGHGSVLVVWNGQDTETLQYRNHLETMLESVFYRKSRQPRSPHVFRGIDTREDLLRCIEKVLSDARDLIVRDAPRVLPATDPKRQGKAVQDGIDPASRPVVQGPVKGEGGGEEGAGA